MVEKEHHIAIIAFGFNVFNYSVNSIAAYLRSKRYKVSVILCDKNENLKTEQLEILVKQCKDVVAIGISVLTTYHLRLAIQVNNYLKKHVDATIVWGGIPIICDPEYYLEYADYVCIGEGEIFMDEFIQNIINSRRVENTRNLAYRNTNGEILRTSPIPLVDVNVIPLPLVDLNDHYVLKRELISLKEDLSLIDIQKTGYRIFPIRGCPYKCSFCCNNRLSKELKGHSRLRKLKPELIIMELQEAEKLVPEFKQVQFYEDDFMARKEDELEYLIKLFKEKINLPININATIRNLSERKIDIIQRNGIEIVFIKIGLQTASQRINREIYKRFFQTTEYIDKLYMIIKRKIPVIVDTISENPYENKDDVLENINFYCDLSAKLSTIKDSHKYIRFNEHILLFYPGTELYYKALRDQKIDNTYINEMLVKKQLKTGISQVNKVNIYTVILLIFSLSLRHNKLLLLLKMLKNPIVLSISKKIICIKITQKVIYKIVKIERGAWKYYVRTVSETRKPYKSFLGRLRNKLFPYSF